MLMKLTISLICAVSLVLVLLTTALFIPSFNTSFYMREYERNGVFERTGLSGSELELITRNIINYLRGANDDLNIINGERVYLFEQREIEHMSDVREQFIFAANVRGLSLLLFAITFFIMTSYKKLKDCALLLKSMRAACAAALVIFVALAVFVTLNFDFAFDLFHFLLYSNDYWILDPNVHLLINMLPTQFFINISIYIGVLFVVFLTGAFTVANLLLFLNKKGCCAK